MRVINPCVGLVTNVEALESLKDNVESHHLRTKAVREGLQSEEVINYLILCIRSFDAGRSNPRRYVMTRQLFTKSYQDIFRFMRQHSIRDIRERLGRCTTSELTRFAKLKTRDDFKEERATVLGSKSKKMSKKDQLNGEKHWEFLVRGGRRGKHRDASEADVLSPATIVKDIFDERAANADLLPFNDSPPYDIPAYRTNSLDPEYEARDRLLKSMGLMKPAHREALRFIDIPPLHRLVLRSRRPYRAVFRLAELENTDISEVEEVFRECENDPKSFISSTVDRALERERAAHKSKNSRHKSDGMAMDVETRDTALIELLASGTHHLLTLEEAVRVLPQGDSEKMEAFQEADKVFDGGSSVVMSGGKDLRYLTFPESKLHRKIIRYLEQTPVCAQSRDVVQKTIEKLSTFDLTRVEVLQLVNLRPSCLVWLHSIVEECASRFSEELQQDLLHIVAELPLPVKVKPEDKALERNETENGPTTKLNEGEKV